MAALDTNVLVRFLVQDDARQLAAATRLVRRCVERGESLFVPVTVALELEWVLRTRFGFDKPTVTELLAQLLASVELRFESEGALEAALQLYRDGGADFSDCLHIGLTHQAGAAPLWTFDRAAARLAGARLVGGHAESAAC